jgi:hypothetical protein
MSEENKSPLNPVESIKPIARPPAMDTAILKPVDKTPDAVPPAPNATAQIDSVEQLKNVTQKLKLGTQQIPAQAVLRATGIVDKDIAIQGLTEAQKNAAKNRTVRIALSDVADVAPVKNDVAGVARTVRIKRPTDTSAAQDSAVATSVPELSPAAPGPSVTQRKTLKISRPTIGAAKGDTKLGVKKTGTMAKTVKVTQTPAADSVPELPPVEGLDEQSSIPELPAVPTLPPDRIVDVPKGLQAWSLLLQIAACAAMGFLGYCLYEMTQLPRYLGGLL